jgi:hypothetical protein
MNYFTPKETSCKCGCGLDIQPETLALANRIREEWGAPLIVASGARCKDHNKAVGGATFSSHMSGIALDLRPARGPVRPFQEWALKRLSKWGVRAEEPEFCPYWLHVDLRPVPPGGSRVFKP